MIVLALGRYGDVINALPAAYALARKGTRARFMVSRQFADILDGVSYVEPLVWDGNYIELPKALRELQRKGERAMVLQAYAHPDRSRQTKSYALEAWRIGGQLPYYGAVPLIFDQRSPEREAELFAQHNDGRPMVLVSPDSISSPFSRGREILELIKMQNPNRQVVDLSEIKAHRVFDLLGIMDQAKLLITVDTVHLHLARASRVPVISIINNGWFGSVPPPQSIRAFRYETAQNDVKPIAEYAKEFLCITKQPGECIHVVDMYTTGQRAERAQEGWSEAYEPTTRTLFQNAWGRSAKAIKDKRDLPYLRDLLQAALDISEHDYDCIVWSNDDVALEPGLMGILRRHVAVWDFVSARRSEPLAGVHMGRDLFAFRAGWLKENLKRIPDYILGADSFDLGLAAFLRNERGIKTTFRNLSNDFFPCDMQDALVYHEPHASAWNSADVNTSQANLHNRKLFKDWAKKAQPQIRFSNIGTICDQRS